MEVVKMGGFLLGCPIMLLWNMPKNYFLDPQLHPGCVCSYAKVEYYLLKDRQFFSFLNWICASIPLFDLLKCVGRKAVNLLLTPGMLFRRLGE